MKQPKIKWIDIKERQPQKDQIVIGFQDLKHKDFRIMILWWDGEKLREWDNEGDRHLIAEYNYITHWSPLPQEPNL